jgi:hypothetical protein
MCAIIFVRKNIFLKCPVFQGEMRNEKGHTVDIRINTPFGCLYCLQQRM